MIATRFNPYHDVGQVVLITIPLNSKEFLKKSGNIVLSRTLNGRNSLGI